MKIRHSSKLRHAGDPRRRNHRPARRAAPALAALTLLGLLLGTAAARDAASGLATGKRAHKPFTITKQYDKATPMLAAGKATGKRAYKPFTFTKQYDKATPMLAAPSKPPAGVNQGGLLDGNAMGGSATSPAATGSPINRGGGSAARELAPVVPA